MIVDPAIFKEEKPHFSLKEEEVDLIYNDYLFYINNLPEKEILKYKQFLESKQFNLVLIEFYQKENCILSNLKLTPYTIQYTRVPDSNWQENQGPYIDEYKKLIDTTVYDYEFSDKYFKNSVEIIKNIPKALKAGILIYKPEAVVPPHAHRDGRALGLAYSHTLLHDIKDGHFDFWHSYNYMKLHKKGETFYFEVDEVHYAYTKSNSVFLAVLCSA